MIGRIENEPKSELHGNDNPEKICFPGEPMRECQKKPQALPPKTTRICLRAMPTL